MAVLHARTEEFLEPVRVAHFSLTKIGFSSLFGVLNHILACGRVVGVHKLGHLAVNTGRRTVDAAGEVEPALLVHFLIDGHLLLGVHYIEFRI